jgi:hypothetical protein
MHVEFTRPWFVPGPDAAEPPTDLDLDLRCLLTSSRGLNAVVREPRAGRAHWPPWWNWDLLMTSHARERMADRGMNEIDLRGMLESATEYERDVVMGRWHIEVKHERRLWHLIVEPDNARELLVLITVYQVEE